MKLPNTHPKRRKGQFRGRVGILSLGCPRNIVDSEGILGRLHLKGYSIVDLDKADIAVLNTCAFIEDAKKESIDAILDLIELKRQGRLKKIIVYGCLSQRYKDTLPREFPEIDAFVGTLPLNNESIDYPITARHYAYLKICEGCVHRCSYCVIPRLKKRFTSLNIESAVNKARGIDKRGVSELNIIGQDITGYGLDIYGKKKLPELLIRILSGTKNIKWIRLLYLYPGPIVEEVARIIKDEPRLCKYIDLPIQHINDRILKLMNRGITKSGILRLIERIRKIIPGAAIRSSVIVGFPSETDREFGELIKFIEDIKFERLGAFIYSREELTPAFNFKGQVAAKLKKERFNAVMLKQQEISAHINERFIGKDIDVIIDESEEGGYLARSRFDAPEVDGTVFVKSKDMLKPGDVARARITDTLEYDLVGEVQS